MHVQVFWLLDEESKLPKPTYEHMTNEVHAKNKEHFRISVPRKSKLKSHRDLRDHEVLEPFSSRTSRFTCTLL